MSNLTPPTQDETLTQYLARFATDEERAVATLTYRAEAKGVKILDEDTGLLGGWGIPFGGPVTDKAHAAGKDLDGEYFDEKTNFCLDWFPNDNRPVLYDHGTDPEVKLGVIGRQTSKFIDSAKGVWVETQLDMANQYAKYILELAKKGVLGYSSGALGGYVRRGKNGQIEQWPWIEQTVTVRPANPYALIASDAVKHLREAGALPPELVDEPAPPPSSLKDALLTELTEAKFNQNHAQSGENGGQFTSGGGGGGGGDARNQQIRAVRGAVVDKANAHIAGGGKLTMPANSGKPSGHAITKVHYHSMGYKVDVESIAKPQFVSQHTMESIFPASAAIHSGLNSKDFDEHELDIDLEDVPETKATRVMSGRNMGQMHQSMKALGDLHGSTCDMGTDCPMYEAPAGKKVELPGIPGMETEEKQKQRREVDAYLATIKLGGR